MIPFKKIALIGTGNVSYAFYKALINNGIYPDCVYTRDVEKISETERHFGIKAISDFKLVMDSDLIIIAVKDDVIKEVSLNLNGFKGALIRGIAFCLVAVFQPFVLKLHIIYAASFLRIDLL